MAAIKTHIQRIIRFPEKNPIIKESRLGLSVLTESSVVKTFFKKKKNSILLQTQLLSEISILYIYPR